MFKLFIKTKEKFTFETINLNHSKMKLLKIFSIALFTLSLASCTFTEEISFNEKGSGKFNMNVDMSGMMDMMGAAKDSTSTGDENFDSIVNVKDILDQHKDKIKQLSAEEQKMYESLKNMTLRTKLDEEKKEFFMNIMMDFKNPSELDNIIEKIKLVNNLKEDKMDETEVSNHKVAYEFSKKKFARKVEMLKLTKEQQEEFDQSLESSAMFLGGSTYKLKYSFAKKIKSVSLKEAVISEDKKSFVYEVSMDELMKNPKLLDFEVKF